MDFYGRLPRLKMDLDGEDVFLKARRRIEPYFPYSD